MPQKVSFSRRSTTISTLHASSHYLLGNNYSIRSEYALHHCRIITLTLWSSHIMIIKGQYLHYIGTTVVIHMDVFLLYLIDSLSFALCLDTKWWMRLLLALINVPWMSLSSVCCFFPPVYVKCFTEKHVCEKVFRIIVIKLAFAMCPFRNAWVWPHEEVFHTEHKAAQVSDILCGI